MNSGKVVPILDATPTCFVAKCECLPRLESAPEDEAASAVFGGGNCFHDSV
jgi:hypothetical protein